MRHLLNLQDPWDGVKNPFNDFLKSNTAEFTFHPQIKHRLHLDPLISKTYSKGRNGLTEALCTMHGSQMEGFAIPPMHVEGGGRPRTAQEEGCPC